MNHNNASIPGGCVLLARKMLDSDLMNQSPLVVKLWVWLLLKANWKDREQLKRGQLVTTIAEMQEAMSNYSGWRKISPTPDQIRSAYGALAHTARVTVRRTTRGMVVSVLNYDTFQDISAYVSHTESRKGNAMDPAAIPHDTEEREERKKEKRISSPESLRLSGLLADLILSNNPASRDLSNGKRDTTVTRWASDIDKLLCLDDQSPEMVEAVIRWCQADSFWRANILSGSTLRKQWDKLTVKIQGTGKRNFNGPQRAGTFDGVL